MANYKNAMNCKKCPQSNGPEGCPAWVEYVETNVADGSIRTTRECFYQAMPKMMQHVICASNRPAAAIESTRNALVNALNGMGKILDKRADAAITAPSPQERLT